MVDAVNRHPGDRAAFERQRTTEGKEVFSHQGQFVRTVCVQPMVSHADAEAGSHPIEEDR